MPDSSQHYPSDADLPDDERSEAFRAERESIHLLVSLTGDPAERFGEVVGELKRAGLQVERELYSIGIVTGSCLPEDIDAIRGVDGVHVEEEREVGLL